MSKKIYIDGRQNNEIRAAVTDNGVLVDYDEETDVKRRIKGNIYLAQISSVEPSLQAAFVDYGENRHGFLSFSEIHPDYYRIPLDDRQKLIESHRQLSLQRDSIGLDDVDFVPGDDKAGDGEDNEGEDSGDEGAGDTDPNTMDDYSNSDAINASDTTSDGSDAEDSEQHQDDHSEERPSQRGRRDGRFRDQANRRRGGGRSRREPHNAYRIQEVLTKGQVLLVQVLKEERGNKGAALSTYLSSAGRYCVLVPNSLRGGGVSKKVGTVQKRNKLKDILKELDVNEGMGIILRTAAVDRTKAEIKRDFKMVTNIWDDIRELTMSSTAPALINQEADIILRVLRDTHGHDLQEVQVAGDACYASTKEHMTKLMPSLVKVVKKYTDTVSVFQHYGIEEQLSSIYGNEVQLPSGGALVITQTEALVAIDVNSGRSTKERTINRTASQTNFEATREIARQLRLRDLAGLIVIDFIDMAEHDQNRRVESAMREELLRDRARTQVGEINQFGIMVMSRQRMRVSFGSTQLSQEGVIFDHTPVSLVNNAIYANPNYDMNARRVLQQLRSVVAEVQLQEEKTRVRGDDPNTDGNSSLTPSQHSIIVSSGSEVVSILFNCYAHIIADLRAVFASPILVVSEAGLGTHFTISLNGNVIVDSRVVQRASRKSHGSRRSKGARDDSDRRNQRGDEEGNRGRGRKRNVNKQKNYERPHDHVAKEDDSGDTQGDFVDDTSTAVVDKDQGFGDAPTAQQDNTSQANSKRVKRIRRSSSSRKPHIIDADDSLSSQTSSGTELDTKITHDQGNSGQESSEEKPSKSPRRRTRRSTKKVDTHTTTDSLDTTSFTTGSGAESALSEVSDNVKEKPPTKRRAPRKAPPPTKTAESSQSESAQQSSGDSSSFKGVQSDEQGAKESDTASSVKDSSSPKVVRRRKKVETPSNDSPDSFSPPKKKRATAKSTTAKKSTDKVSSPSEE